MKLIRGEYKFREKLPYRKQPCFRKKKMPGTHLNAPDNLNHFIVFYFTQSAINKLVSCEPWLLRFDDQTSFLPSGENIGNALK